MAPPAAAAVSATTNTSTTGVTAKRFVKKKSVPSAKKSASATAVPSSADDGTGPTAWQAVLGCTPHSLALFRIGLGSLLTLELVLRFRFLLPFYTDEGTLPLRLLMPKVDDLYQTVCLHCHYPFLWQQQILLSIQVGLAVLLTVGEFTRLSAILSWYLYFSLTLRNTWMNYILDRYFHYLLFLAIFLPLNRVWSLDSSSSSNSSSTNYLRQQQMIVSPATIAMKALVVWIYIDAGVGKYMDPLGGWSYSADPLPALDTYARHTLVARYMYALLQPEGLRIMTPLVVWVELFAAPVALWGSYLRSKFLVNTAAVLIISLHVGIALTLRNAALLSFVASVAWCPLFPLGWNHIDPSVSTTSNSIWKYLWYTISFVSITAMVAGNIWLGMYSQICDQSVKHIWSTLLHNRWNVFVGAEEYVTWEIAPGLLADQTTIVDVWGRRDTVDWSLPGTGAPCTATARPGRWRSFPYLADLEDDDFEALWSYLCREWDLENQVHQNPHRQLLKFNFFMLQADVLPNMTFSATRKRLLTSYDCVKPLSSMEEETGTALPLLHTITTNEDDANKENKVPHEQTVGDARKTKKNTDQSKTDDSEKLRKPHSEIKSDSSVSKDESSTVKTAAKVEIKNSYNKASAAVTGSKGSDESASVQKENSEALGRGREKDVVDVRKTKEEANQSKTEPREEFVIEDEQSKSINSAAEELHHGEDTTIDSESKQNDDAEEQKTKVADTSNIEGSGKDTKYEKNDKPDSMTGSAKMEDKDKNMAEEENVNEEKIKHTKTSSPKIESFDKGSSTGEVESSASHEDEKKRETADASEAALADLNANDKSDEEEEEEREERKSNADRSVDDIGLPENSDNGEHQGNSREHEETKSGDDLGSRSREEHETEKTGELASSGNHDIGHIKEERVISNELPRHESDHEEDQEMEGEVFDGGETSKEGADDSRDEDVSTHDNPVSEGASMQGNEDSSSSDPPQPSGDERKATDLGAAPSEDSFDEGSPRSENDSPHNEL